VDLTFEAGRGTSADEINAAIATAAHGPLNGVLDVTGRELVSSDFNHNPMSAVFATDQTRVMDGNFCRVLAWYDNEWGFSSRMLDVAAEMGRRAG